MTPYLITYRRTLPLTSSFGDGTTSSSDGIRFGMAASDLQARHLPRYFGMRRGVTLYNHVNNRGDQYWIDVVNCLMRSEPESTSEDSEGVIQLALLEEEETES